MRTSITIKPTASLAAIAAIVASASVVRPAPTWYEDATEVPALAAQSGRGLVMYFETAQAEDCVRMDEETWPKLPAVIADENFIWLRLNPEDDPTFFSHYEIFLTPTIIFLDSALKEQERVQGYLSAGDIQVRLRTIRRGSALVATTRQGQAVPKNQAARVIAHSAELALAGHYFVEPFDAFETLGAIRYPEFQLLKQSSIRIDPTAGMYGSPCLIIDSGSQESAIVRFDIFKKLGRVDQIQGRIRVRAKMRAISLGQDVVNVAALSVAGGSGPPRRWYLTLADRHAQWTDRDVTTDVIDFRRENVSLTFQVNWTGQSFMVEDLRVDLMPVNPALAAAAAQDELPDPSRLLAAPTEDPLFRRYDANGDGKIIRSEIKDIRALQLFDHLDENKDQVLHYREAQVNFAKIFGRAPPPE